MPRYKLILEYDGTPFVGWQMQENGRSVQGRLAEAIKAFSGDDIVPRGAGRTDAGVHALGQVAHIDLAKDWAPDKIRDALNAQLRPDPVSVLACERADEDFDARFSATARHYLYRIVDRRAPLGARPRTVPGGVRTRSTPRPCTTRPKLLIGHHDFTTFRSTECQAKSPMKTLDRLDVSRDGDEISDRGHGALVPAQSGALDGRLAEAGRRGQVDRRPTSNERSTRVDRSACGPVAPAARPLPRQGRLLTGPSAGFAPA